MPPASPYTCKCGSRCRSPEGCHDCTRVRVRDTAVQSECPVCHRPVSATKAIHGPCAKKRRQKRAREAS